MVKNLPSDQAIRDRFVNEPERNFSVIAPAGVGKTKAIVDRVVAIATGDAERARDWLPRLVVVTYTKKAADEMHQRARNAIIERKVDLAVLSHFNRAFFGTIHSFCVKLLRSHGHLLGLTGQIEAVEDDDDLWRAFVRQLDVVAPRFPILGKNQCVRFQPLENVMNLARKIRREHVAASDTMPTGECPAPRLDALLNFQPKGASKKTIPGIQENLRRWQKLVAGGAPFVPMPDCGTNTKDFVELWESAFGPPADWLRRATWQMAVEVAGDYRAFRIAQGRLTYDDQIDLALDLVRDARAGAQLRAEDLRVILDEAQDTDPSQFNILLELARPKTAAGVWLETGGDAPEAGRFCMVGDPQQSIYGSRAGLAHYAAVREKLVCHRSWSDGIPAVGSEENRRLEAVAPRPAEEINFDVTFRCDRAIIEAVNKLAAPMLDGEDGQAEFCRLQARPDAGAGQVLRFDAEPMPPREDGKKNLTDDIALHEARQLARWMREQGLAKFGAAKWADVAILCPRRRWLEPVEQALIEQELIPQIHSDNSIRGDSPAYAWFAALFAIMAGPRDGFEIAGVLREVFGISDDELFRFTGGDGSKLQILTADYADAANEDREPSSAVCYLSEAHLDWQRQTASTALQFLAALRAEIIPLPLRDAAHRIVEATALRERLDVIGAQPEELDGLLALASAAETHGASLRDFAETLREDFENGLPARPVDENAVQLFTCHKAKGLQWEAVIVPFMFRNIATKPDYPSVLQGAPGMPPRVVFDKNDIGDLKDVLERRRRQEHQRLLYVALTRAKQTLVVVDDHRLITKGRADSFADLLGMVDEDGNEVFNECWQHLPLELRELPARPAPVQPPPPEVSLPAPGAHARDAAAAASAQSPRRVLPYALAEKMHDPDREERRDEHEEKSEQAEAARLYGIWWHEMAEMLDWRLSPGAIMEAAAIHLVRCPQTERGRTEIGLLMKSPVPDLLRDPETVIHREMPFLFPRGATECVEGVMDLAIFHPRENRWLVLDWKTNVVTAARAPSLCELYAPQLGAYADALRGITGLPVATGIYSTATGLWLPLD